jgi:hypothetical protein
MTPLLSHCRQRSYVSRINTAGRQSRTDRFKNKTLLEDYVKMSLSNADHFAMLRPYSNEANQILSALQRERQEAGMLRSLGDSMGVEFRPKSLPLPGGGVMEIGGYSSKANTVCEVCMNEGTLTAEEEEMILLNALKLNYAAQTLGNTVRKIMLFRDRTAAQGFCNSPLVRDAMGDDSLLEVCVLMANA